jgi:hypothetical protein
MIVGRANQGCRRLHNGSGTTTVARRSSRRPPTAHHARRVLTGSDTPEGTSCVHVCLHSPQPLTAPRSPGFEKPATRKRLRASDCVKCFPERKRLQRVQASRRSANRQQARAFVATAALGVRRGATLPCGQALTSKRLPVPVVVAQGVARPERDPPREREDGGARARSGRTDRL